MGAEGRYSDELNGKRENTLNAISYLYIAPISHSPFHCKCPQYVV